MEYSEMSNSIKNLSAAQLKMQQELEDIGKDTQGYGYKYTSFDQLVKYLRPLLTKHGLSFIQMPVGNNDEIGLQTIYMHTSGEWITSLIKSPIVDAKQMNIYQSIGSAITYFRRYSLSAFVGIASDEDNDTKEIKKSNVTVKMTKELDTLVKDMYSEGSLDATAEARYTLRRGEGYFDSNENWQTTYDSLTATRKRYKKSQKEAK